MRLYFASRFSRQADMRSYADEARAAGFEVTSRWPYVHETEDGLGDMGPATAAPAFAWEDVDDVLAADALVSFTEGGGGRGGRHVEYGIALAQHKRLVIVGPREHVFHSLAERFDTFAEALDALRTPAFETSHSSRTED